MDGSDPFEAPDWSFFAEHPDLKWPAWKFDMDITDAWTTLARQFNSLTIPLLSCDTFRRDVSYLSVIAQDREEFLALLKERRDMREKELTELFKKTFLHLCQDPNSFDYKPGVREDGHWVEATCFANTKSFDTLIGYFASFLPLADRQALANNADFSLPHQIETAALSTDTIPAIPSQTEDTLSLPDTEPPQMPSPPAPARRRTKGTGMSRGVRSGRVQKPTQQQQQGPRRSSRLQQKKEPLEHHANLQPHTGTTSQTAGRPGRKRKSSENYEDVEPQATASRSKRRKITPSTEPLPVAAKSVGKRKSSSDEVDDDEPRATVSGTKRRKTDTSTRPPPAAATSTSKIKGGSEGSSCDGQPPAATTHGESGTKRRKMDESDMSPPAAVISASKKMTASGEADESDEAKPQATVSGTERMRVAGRSGGAAKTRTRKEPRAATSSTKSNSRVTKSGQRGKRTS
ncbi:hypothetical protein VM1G_07533 [Cytospora mali]|uniref:Uncharacterized protein n=1 Tax=Cytospora mali TaxID=578113 RepID=A0A194W760_CYTMA|nr:hypothetical protein VM1G_07533 [Valsa mali]